MKKIKKAKKKLNKKKIKNIKKEQKIIKNTPGGDVLEIVKQHELPTGFSEKCINQAGNVAKPVSEADRQGRLDLRDLVMVTIDGEDARDLDDAVSLQMDGEKYVLGVHIADVTNYVQYKSALDREALKRGTSVYLVDRVIPMLPKELSNGICSLNAGEDRLALSCIMTIGTSGDVLSYDIKETVINVNERMSYTSVNKILEDKDEAETQKYESLVPMFEKMLELSHVLRQVREDRGAVDFDFPETKVELDEKGYPIDIHPYPRGEAHRMIEDFMLIANETVARDAFKANVPFVYRIHEKPDMEKTARLKTFIQNFGITVARGKAELTPFDIQEIVARVKGKDEEKLVSTVALRSMMQAKYSVDCTGHFGLAAKYYCHFTSPIRRYPDLQIHRIIKDRLRGRMNADKMMQYSEFLPGVAERSSERERKAVEAERDSVKLKKVQFMENRVGEEFDATISGVTSFGIYVELPNTVEGLVFIGTIKGDHYVFMEDEFALVGKRTGKRYVLGQPVRVRLIAVDLVMKNIDFELVDEE